jgi:hypothetical protein
MWLWTVWNRQELPEKQGLFLQELFFLRSCLFLPVVVVVALLLLLLLLLYGRIEICSFVFAAALETWRTWSCYYCFHMASKTISKSWKIFKRTCLHHAEPVAHPPSFYPRRPNLSPLFLSLWKYYFSYV